MSAATKNVLLECDSIELRVGFRSLIKKFSMQMAPAESIAVVGPNGLGKTTLLRTLCGMSRPYRGSVYLKGQMLWPDKVENLSTDSCFLASQPALFLDHSVMSNMEFYLRSLARPVIPEKIKEDLKRVGLADRLEQTARTLSTGQKRRLTLAFLMAAKPQLLFLDEPTNGLDQEGVKLCLQTLDNLREQGSALLVATHDTTLIDWCQRSVNLKEWAP